MSADPAIRCTALTRRFGDVAALDGFDLVAPEGSVVSVLGPSGSGKTTALRVIAGFEDPDSGTVEVGGRIVAGSGRSTPPEHRRVGMVFQHFALFPHLDVAGNVGYGLRRTGRRARRVAEILEMVGLPDAAERMPHELSGGEQQRVALARALAPDPEVILLDEPFSNLDAPRRDRVRREMHAILVEARTTAVFVTHDQEEALAMSDEVAVMRAGRVVQQGNPTEVYLRPVDRWVARFLGDAEFLDGTVSRPGVVDTPLGRFAIARDGVSGPVDVMIRPESVRLTADPSGDSLVVSREFFGHDQLVTLHLNGGHRLLARTGPMPLHPGDRVSVEITDVVVFGRNRTSASGDRGSDH